MKTKPLIIFDIDGTLANTVEIDDFCYVSTIKTLYDIDLGKIDWNELSYVSDWGVCKLIVENVLKRKLTEGDLASTKSHFFRLLRQYSNKNPEYFLEIPGAVDFFTRLKDESIPRAIATGGWEESAKFKLDQIGLDYGDVPFAHSDHHFARAELTKIAIKMAEDQNETEFSRIVYFGDGEWDFSTCKELGIEFIGIDNKKSRKLKELGVKTIFENFIESEKIMEVIHASD